MRSDYGAYIRTTPTKGDYISLLDNLLSIFNIVKSVYR